MPSYTLHDVQALRAAYDKEMAAADDRKWAAYREGFQSLRRLPATEAGWLAATGTPRPVHQPQFKIEEVK